MTEIDDLLAEGTYSMFMPNDRNDLLLDYPELRSVPSFQALSARPKELLFVWYMACRASPAVRRLHSDRQRIEFAVRAVWGTPTKDMLEKYLNKKWSKEIDQAIGDMHTFELGPRIINKLLCERIQKSVQAVIDRELQETMNWSERKDALAAIDKAMDILPKCLKMAEGDFGIVQGSISEEDVGSVMERLHLTPMEEV